MTQSDTIKSIPVQIAVCCPDCQKVLLHWDTSYKGMPKTLELTCSCGFRATTKLQIVPCGGIDAEHPVAFMLGYYIVINKSDPEGQGVKP
jgi:hypothetical protein